MNRLLLFFILLAPLTQAQNVRTYPSEGVDQLYYTLPMFELEEAHAFRIDKVGLSSTTVSSSDCFNTNCFQAMEVSREAGPQVGLEETTAVEISLYPNPAQDFIMFGGASTSALTYHLIDLNGRLLNSGITTPGLTKQISLMDMPSGTYVIRIIHEDQQPQAFRFVKL